MAALNKKNTESPTPPVSARLERWVILVGLLLVLAFNFALRWRLAEIPLERDEGEYAYAGQLLLQGIPPYQLAYNMKFPGAYAAYGLLMAVFGESTRGIHFGMACVTSLTALLVFVLGRKLTHAEGGLLAAASCVLLSATPAALGLAGHATHFVALFAAAGMLALLKASEQPGNARWCLAGILFGIAILMKQHAFILAAAGLAWLAGWNWHRRKDGARRAAIESAAAFAAGCAMPLLLTFLALAAAGVWQQFTFWTIRYAAQYASAVAIENAWDGFFDALSPLFASAWPLWCAGGIGLVACLPTRRNLNRSAALFLFLGGMLATLPGFHFRGHYYLMAMPGLALLIAVCLTTAADWINRRRGIPSRVAWGGFFMAMFALTAWQNREVWFELTPHQVARRLYTLNPFPESAPVADYLREHTAPDERIAVIGSEPQIYFHARRRSATGYIYMYALTEPLPLAQKMRDDFIREVETAKPRYLVFVDITGSWVSLSVTDKSILTWWNQYVQNYDPVAAATLAADQPTSYCWDEAVVRTLNLADCHLIIYRRKP